MKTKKDLSMWNGTKHLIIHKIALLISNNVDVLFVSKFLGLTAVVVYSSYNYILSNMITLIGKINTSIYSIVGDSLVTDTEERNYSIFLECNTLIFFIANVICGSLIYATTPFIQLFYGKDISAPTIVMVLFILLLYYRIIRASLNTYSNSGGLFKETKICAVLEAIINLSLSFSLVIPFGMSGVLFATFVSYIVADFAIRPYLLHKHIFHKSVKKYYFDCFICIIPFIITSVLFLMFIANIFAAKNLLFWLLYSIIIGTGTLVFNYIYFVTLKKAAWKNRFIKLLKEKVKHEK